MTQLIHLSLMCCGFALTAFAMSYSIMAWYAVSEPNRSSPFTARGMPPVTMLKPLCGAELETYECLRSFCVQEYPEYQIVFGVADANDPSVAIVEKLQREFPQLDLQIAIDRRQHGSSRKVSNLMNMMALARHEFLVLSDSDVRVGPDYLAVVVAPLLDKSVGIVTCPYRGIPRHGVWALLGSLYINEWFMPSVRVAAMSGSRSFAFGATIAIRREVLTSIGGFSRIANQLADDYLLGELTRRLGLRTVLSEVVVDVFVTERSVGELVRHELRWLRTIRAVRPVGYAFSFITFGTPVAALGCLLASNSATAIGMLAMTVLTRVMLHVRTRKPGSAISQLFLWPLRDTLSLALWCWSFVTRRVHWRDDRYRVSRDGTAWRVEAI